MVDKLAKEELINHYAGGDIHKFTQIDGWTGDIADSLVRTDKDNDWICLSETYELRRSPKELAVRVFIHEGTKRKDALRLLEKIYAMIKQRPSLTFNFTLGTVNQPKLYNVLEEVELKEKEKKVV